MSPGFSTVIVVGEAPMFNAVGFLPSIDTALGSVALFDTTPVISLSDLLVFVPITDGLGVRTGTGFAFCSVTGVTSPAALPICTAAPQPYDVNMPENENPFQVAPGVFAHVTTYTPTQGQPGFTPSDPNPPTTFVVVSDPVGAPEPASASLMILPLAALAMFVRRRHRQAG